MLLLSRNTCIYRHSDIILKQLYISPHYLVVIQFIYCNLVPYLKAMHRTLFCVLAFLNKSDKL